MNKSSIEVVCTVGADPEMFVMNDKGVYVSSHDLLPGTKHNPYKVKDGAVQVDGTAAEFNIDPAASEEQFLNNLDSVISTMASMMPGYKVVADPVAHYTAEYMAMLPDSAKELGCDPDFNAYTGEANPRPDQAELFRTGAGHVHIGVTEGANPSDMEYMGICCGAVKLMDWFLGIPSLLFDDNDERRRMYGKAGAFRPKSYGLEYRTLSNVWLRKESTRKWVYWATQQAVGSFLKDYKIPKRYSSESIQDIINTSNRKEARIIVEENYMLTPTSVFGG